MTSVFETLCDAPQTEIDLGQLSPDERMVVDTIHINGTVGVTQTDAKGDFTGVFYIIGDEKRAAERFVEQNRSKLETIDFSRRNPISTSVDRDVYDWILHALGERELEVYDTVVIERRPDDIVWCLGRQTFEETPMRRYTESGTGSAKLNGVSLEELYESFGHQITESTLEAESTVRGDVRVILDAFRQSPAFACRPTAVDDELAITKLDANVDRGELGSDAGGSDLDVDHN